MTQALTTVAQRPAFEEIYEEYREPMLRYARSHLRAVPPEDVRDIVADVWVKIYEALPSWENRSLPIGAWLYKTMRNAVIDWVRANSGRQWVMFDPSSHDSLDEVSEREYLGILSNEIMDGILAALDGQQQELIRLVYVENWRLAEVAQHFEVTLDAIKKMHRRALGRIRTYLETGATRRKRGSSAA